MAFDLEGARKAGYSDSEILASLAGKHKFDLEGAKKAGYGDSDIIQALSSRETQPTPQETGLEKASRYSNNVMDAITAPIQPLMGAIGKTVSGIEEASKNASEAEAERGNPVGAMIPAIPELLIKGIKKPFQMLDKAGEKTAEFAGKHGYPNAGAALGTAIQMAPDIAMGAEGIAKRALIADALRGGARAVGKVASKAGEIASSPVRGVVDALKTPDLRASLRESLNRLPISKAAEEVKLEELRRTFGKKIEESRAAAGIPQQPLSKLPIPKDLNEFADEMRTLAKRKPQDLVDTMGADGIAQLKDTIQQLRESGDLKHGTRASAQVNEAVNTLDDALSLTSPDVADNINLYRKTLQQQEGLPGHYKELTADLRLKLLKTKGSSTKRALISQALKGAATGIAGGAGYSAGKALGLY